MSMLKLAALLALALVTLAAQEPGTKTPGIDDLIGLQRAGPPAISPDSRLVAYTIRQANWDENAYHTEIWLADAETGELRQLTNHKKSSSAPAWSPDGRTLAFASDREEKRQIYLIDPRGGEARKLTSLEDGVGSFEWAPDGKRLAYTATDPKPDTMKDREKKYGEYDAIGQDHQMSQLYVLDVASKESRRLTNGAFTVGRFSWSPDGKQIAFTSNRDGNYEIYVMNADGSALRNLTRHRAQDNFAAWSPDGKKIAFISNRQRGHDVYLMEVK